MTGIQFPHTALTTKKLADIKDIIYMLPTCWAYYIHTVTDKTSVIWHSMYYGTIPPIVRPAQQSSACRYLGPFPLSGKKITIPA